jgi:hypothetical protein
MSDEDEETIESLISKRGRAFVENILARHHGAKEEVLTIVCNEGLHPIPDEYIQGEVYIASKGNLDFSSAETIHKELDSIAVALKMKLHQKKWSKIILVPFGHSVICMNIKMIVYRVLRIETIDLFHCGAGKYAEIQRETRSVLT